MIVVDTNVIAYLYVEGEYSACVETLLQTDPIWVAPYLWRSEFRNVLALYMRKKILGYYDVVEIIRLAEKMMTGNEYTVSSEGVLKLAENSGCSAYDCEFVYLAQFLDVPLVTADVKIRKQFPKNCISLSAFSNH